MPIYPPRDSQSFRKKEVVEKRERQLLHAIKNQHSEGKVRKCAEKVIEAKLNFIKGTLYLLKLKVKLAEEQRENKQIKNLEKQKKELLEMPVEEVIEQYKIEVTI